MQSRQSNVSSMMCRPTLFINQGLYFIAGLYVWDAEKKIFGKLCLIYTVYCISSWMQNHYLYNFAWIFLGMKKIAI